VNSVIRVRDLGKKYRRYSDERPYTLQEAVAKGLRGLRPVEYHWALRGLTFDVKRGSMIGIIGHNGAGKSTLLRLLGGVGRPDEGSLTVDGVVGGLLDIGAGFHPDLTGKENVYINGIISGLLRSEVDARFNDIIAFAELEEVINDPLRTYSTGMLMRLGFAVAAHTDPDILLIDEVLAVGDVAFQQKCIEYIRQLQRVGKTIVYVSHDSNQIREMCDDAILLRKGVMVQRGKPAGVLSAYMREMGVEA
jgi:lipopolysaccharide transport system ATP-binding protein